MKIQSTPVLLIGSKRARTAQNMFVAVVGARDPFAPVFTPVGTSLIYLP